jgi:hypothetical protein
VCYKKGGYLAITDANLQLGRILPEMFPKIFGPNEVRVHVQVAPQSRWGGWARCTCWLVALSGMHCSVSCGTS